MNQWHRSGFPKPEKVAIGSELSDFDSPDAIVKYKSGWIFQIINTPA
jgi:hypothetical protein